MTSMTGKIVVTGGAGFIGSNLVRTLIADGWDVFVLDALIEQVHPGGKWKKPPQVKFFHGDIRDRHILAKCLESADYIVHLAAETGVGQSSYEIARYVSVNEFGTAMLLEGASGNTKKLRGIILASSRAVYGESRYRCKKCGVVHPVERSALDLSQGRWEPPCPICAERVKPVASVEDQPLYPTSVYGVTKFNQEQLVEQFSRIFDIPSVALRFQNVYGPGQSLNNPYTGILSIFSTRIMADNPLFIYEDGNETRDFVYIYDVVQSICLLLKSGFSGFDAYNVGTGNRTSVLEVAKILVGELNADVPIEICGKYRVGDIRHAWADMRKIQEKLGFKPMISIREGLKDFVAWVNEQPPPEDRYASMEKEMIDRGLLGRAGRSYGNVRLKQYEHG